MTNNNETRLPKVSNNAIIINVEDTMSLNNRQLEKAFSNQVHQDYRLSPIYVDDLIK